MTIALHKDVAEILMEEATSLNITPEEAANFLIRFATSHKALICEREMLILDSSGNHIYRHDQTC